MLLQPATNNIGEETNIIVSIPQAVSAVATLDITYVVEVNLKIVSIPQAVSAVATNILH